MKIKTMTHHLTSVRTVYIYKKKRWQTTICEKGILAGILSGSALVSRKEGQNTSLNLERKKWRNQKEQGSWFYSFMSGNIENENEYFER